MLSLGKVTHKRGEDLMRFSTNQHRFYCGIDLHARTVDVCISRHGGARRAPRHMPAAPAPFLTAVTPYREGLVVAVECLCTWSWLAEPRAAQAIPFGLGHALSMQALHGSQANNAKIASHKMAA